ncbi:pyruvate, water dikinase regulatory protein [Candidatus Tisiphia endosymbiont of Neophilaenus lineatus]|uniref:pyruvate, water dikinase regulatory protein n=1 Tax=Candidatus Tisiphia endosymbiont of Neophilaenus lineatus TaxID=3139336 RepID=UPI0035C9AB25
MNKLIIHLVSDSSVQTVKHAANTALSQFSKIESKLYHWPMLRNAESLNEVLKKIKMKPSIVLYTILDHELRRNLTKFCYDLKIPCISVVGRIVKEISVFLGVETEESLVYDYKFDEGYFDKIHAIDYTLRHDDGQMTSELDEADIILIGPSRTSKTPTSVYLAYNGFKTANVPYIHGYPFLDSLRSITKQLVIGLIINPTRLIEIRETRMHLLQMSDNTNYTDFKTVQEECMQVKQICEQQGWPIIDVSRRSVEETAAVAMKLYYDRKKYVLNNLNTNIFK